MKILMFTWEFPPLISGGLGMACYGMVKALLALGIKIDLVLPTKEAVYFPLRQESDVDTLPAVFMDASMHRKYLNISFSSLHERLEYIGISGRPESYIQLDEIRDYLKEVKKETWQSVTTVKEEQELFADMTAHLIGDEDLVKKVQE